MPGKAVISLTNGLEDSEKVTVAYLVAVGAAENGRPTLMFLTKEAVRLAVDGTAVGVACDGCPPLGDLVKRYEAAGKTRKRVAVELVVDLERIYRRKKAADKELKALVAATGTSLLGLNGIGPSGAARLLVEVGDLSLFPDRNHCASWTGYSAIGTFLRW